MRHHTDRSTKQAEFKSLVNSQSTLACKEKRYHFFLKPELEGTIKQRVMKEV